jgi:exodeoxyribonuclease-5
MKLNTGQQQAVTTMVDGFLNGTSQGLTLLGEGGTGKTTCVMWAVEAWLKAGLRVVLTAPTNKAVKQLERAASEYGLNSKQMAFMTIHKALGLALLPSEENKYTSKMGAGCLGDFDVLVIDEGSMISSYAWFSYILPEIEEHNLKTVVMGDDMQLPPVKETESKALQFFPYIKLTEVERFEADSGISQITTALRDCIDNRKRFNFNAADYPSLETVKPAFFLNLILDAFTADTDLEQTRVLAWRNIRVDTINRAVRTKIYGKGRATFEIGERVVTGAPIYCDTSRELLLSTDEECYVRNVTLSSMMDDKSGEEYNTYLLTLEPIYADIKTVHCHVIHESSVLKLEEELSKIVRKAKSGGNDSRRHWAKWHTLRDMFAAIKYCYCITVHRSQGSTYQTVLVDTDDLLKNNRQTERNKLLYVAFSRASKELITSKERFSS